MFSEIESPVSVGADVTRRKPNGVGGKPHSASHSRSNAS